MALVVNGWHLGGIVTFCTNLSAGLRNRGHEVVLLAIHHAGAQNPVPSGLFDECVVLPRGVSRTGPFVAKVAQTVDRLNPDVLVLNATPYGMAALPYIGRAILRLPVIQVPEEAELALTNSMWWDRVIVVSEFVAQRVRARDDAERLSVCPLGVPLPAGRRPARNPLPGPLQIVSAGRIVVPQKHMERLPAIARLLAERKVDFRWTVLGDGAYLGELRREIGRLGLSHRFEFKGSVAPAAVAGTFRASDVFILVSDYEGLPQALLEAMAQGVVPVVSRIDGSTTCPVEPGKSGYLCEPSEPAAFAGAVTELALNPALRSEMGLRAAETIARGFSVEALTGRFLDIVHEVRSVESQRASPLPRAQAHSAPRPYQCLGFWRGVRNHTLGRMKRWVVQKRCRMGTPVGGGLPPSI